MARGLFLARWIGCVACLSCLAACGPSAPQPSKSALASGAWVLNPAQSFKDPKAQALALAVQNGDIAGINHLMRDEHVDPDHYFGDDGYGPGNLPLLAWPIFVRNPDSLKAMLDNGADPNARNPGIAVMKYPNGKTVPYCNYDSAMVWAAKAENPIYLKLLLAHGGDPNVHTINCESLLFQAFIWHNQWQNVQVLVEHGANVNADTNYDPKDAGDDYQGGSILGDYTAYDDFDKAWWLVAHGADPHYPRWRHADGSPRYPALEDIFWYPAMPEVQKWQTGLQCWALQHGYHRPPVMPDYYQRLRRDNHLPDQEKDIPLPDCKGVATPASSG
jgi:hypothetical protein